MMMMMIVVHVWGLIDGWTGCGAGHSRPLLLLVVVVIDRGRLYGVAVVKSSGGGGRALFELFHLVVALPLHAPVLKPDLDLSLGEAQLVGQLGAASSSQVAVEVELFLQLQRLMARVRRPRPLRVATVAAGVYTTTNQQQQQQQRHHRHHHQPTRMHHLARLSQPPSASHLKEKKINAAIE